MVPKVSWLVPIYNAMPYLEASLLSIQNQSFRDFEVVAIDDGSTDGSADVIRRFCETDERFRHVQKENSGIVDTLNLGLSHCRGELIARMDGDDLCEPHRLAIQVAYMDNHIDCVVAGSRVTVIDATGAIFRQSFANQWKEAGPAGFPPRAITLTHPTMILRAKALRAAGNYRRGFLVAEDYDLLFRLARLGHVVELPDYLLQYRVHAGSESAIKISRQRISCLKAEISAYLENTGQSDAALGTLTDDVSLEDLCCVAESIDRDLPNADMLHAYYAAEFLHRATYRLSRTEAAGAAWLTFKRLKALLPHATRRSARFFGISCVRELLRWAVVNSIGRNATRSGT